jgi:hypothetical protein
MSNIRREIVGSIEGTMSTTPERIHKIGISHGTRGSA